MRGVAGMLSSAEEADAAVVELTRAGFGAADISIELADASTEKRRLRRQGVFRRGSVAGAGAGAVIGALAGLFALVVPGFSSAIVAWLVVLIATGAGAAVGGLLGAAIAFGVPERAQEAGGVLVAVRTEAHEDQVRAVEVFSRLGVTHVLMGFV